MVGLQLKKNRAPAGSARIVASRQIGKENNVGEKYMGYSGNAFNFSDFDVDATRFTLTIWSEQSFEVQFNESPFPVFSTAYYNCEDIYHDYIVEFDIGGYSPSDSIPFSVISDGTYFLQGSQSYFREFGPKMNLKCEDTFASLGMAYFEVYDISCPLYCGNEPVYGTSGYHRNSSVCASAKHSGVIAHGSRSAQTFAKEIVPYFNGTTSNGINSMDMYSEMDWAYEFSPDRSESHKIQIRQSPNMFSGFGRVDLPSILPFERKKPSSQSLIVHSFGDQSESIPDSGNHTYCFVSRANRAQIQTTLTWFDIPTDYMSGYSQIILNLDLEVQKIGRVNKAGQLQSQPGEVVYPNGRSSADMINNVEQISLKAKRGEVFCARVSASSFAGAASTVKYALVTSGPVDEFDRGYD